MGLNDKFYDICSSLLESTHRERVVKALERWHERRDPSACYHFLSKLDPTYYGWSVRVREYREFFKVYPDADTVDLPPVTKLAGVDVFEAIVSRRSRRVYARKPLSLEEASNMLFYTVGVTGVDWWGGPTRTYPSAGALQPVEAYLLAGNVEGLKAGVYHYNPGRHLLEAISYGDPRRVLYEASLEQEHLRTAPATIALTIVYSRTASKYDLRGYRYALLDAGFAGMNVYLAAEALGLATVAVGAFYDDMICNLLGIDCEWEYPLLLFPVGKRS